MSFLEEYTLLKKKFPRRHQIESLTEDCEYTNHLYDSNKCYYCFDSAGLSECLYVIDSYKEKDSIDSLWNAFCDHCLEVSDSAETNNSAYCQYLGQCYNMWYSFNCGSCHDCFGCYNLGNREYCIFNVQYTEEEYLAKLPELKRMPPEEVINKVKTEVEIKFPKIQSYFNDNNNSEYVDYVYKSNAAYYCFDCTSLDDCLYLNNSNECSGSIDSTYCLKTDNSVECTDCAESFNCYQAQECNRCYDSAFIYYCNDCHDCFGCVNLTNKQYCILNIQYTKEEYLAKLKQIKQEIGVFFPQESVAATAI